MNNIGLKIKILREKHSLSQEKLANHLDVSQASLCRIESGHTDKVDFMLMQKVCDFFDVKFEYFLEDSFSQENKENKNSAISIFGNSTVNNSVPENFIELVIQNQKQISEMLDKQNELINRIIKNS